MGRGERIVVRAVTFLFAGSVFLAGANTLRNDLVSTFRDSDPSVFPSAFPEQVRRVEQIAPRGAGLLLVASADDAWQARLWQRALYPRNPVVVRYRPLPSGEELEELRRSSVFVLTLGKGAAPDLPLSSEERLGDGDVRIGALRP